jgi:hypothetical protein
MSIDENRERGKGLPHTAAIRCSVAGQLEHAGEHRIDVELDTNR